MSARLPPPPGQQPERKPPVRVHQRIRNALNRAVVAQDFLEAPVARVFVAHELLSANVCNHQSESPTTTRCAER